MASAGWCAYMQAQQEKQERARLRAERQAEREYRQQKWEQEHHTSELCPKCGNKMYIRNGSRGKFLGCSNYPECKGTKPYKGY